MAAGDLITTNMQFEWNDVLIGTGTRYVLQTARGLGLPPVRSNDTDRTRQHGVTPGLDRLGGRTIDLAFVLAATSNSELEQSLTALDALIAIDETEAPLVWQLPNQEKRRVLCRLREFDYPVDIPFGMRQATVLMRFFASDPFIYSNDSQEVVTGRELPGSGVIPPFVVPFTLGASVGGAVTVPNDGTVAAPWTARLGGPLTNPEILNLDTGDRLAFTANGGVDLAPAEWIDIDSARRSLLFNGTADRRTQLSIDSDFFDIDPGGNNLKLVADAGSGTLTINVRDAFYS